MSGHSKWATIKRAKAITDAKKGAIFTKLSNLITIAAREKGGDPDTNFSLRMAIEKAKQANMPKDNIERAIKKGTGELQGNIIEELYYEGVGPANSQFVIKCLTDSKNRTAANIRHIFTKFGGSLSAVMWNFQQMGVIRISKDKLKIPDKNFENFELELIDKGADDILKEDEGLTIYTNSADLKNIEEYLEAKNIETESADLEFVAKSQQEVSDAEKEKIENFIEELENNEDISDYYTNVNL